VPEVAVDPVCGMEVAVGAAKETAVHEGQTFYFCASGCRSRFEADAARYLLAARGHGQSPRPREDP